MNRTISSIRSLKSKHSVFKSPPLPSTKLAISSSHLNISPQTHAPKPAPRCPQHNNPFEAFCNDCGRCVCIVCVIGNSHKDHCVEALQAVFGKQRQLSEHVKRQLLQHREKAHLSYDAVFLEKYEEESRLKALEREVAGAFERVQRVVDAQRSLFASRVE